MFQQLTRSLSQLKQTLTGKGNLPIDTAKMTLKYLLFPTVYWLMLWLAVRLSSNSVYWSTNLIETFALPLSIVFFAYRLVALLIQLFGGQGVYNVLVDRFFFPLLLTYIVIQTMGLFTEIGLLGDTELLAFGETKFTLRSLFIISVGLYLWLTGVDGFSQLFRNLLTRHIGVEEGALDGYLILLRYFLIGFGLFVGFSQLKLDTTAIAAISGGLAVGVGFALETQSILFEKYLLIKLSKIANYQLAIADKLIQIKIF